MMHAERERARWRLHLVRHRSSLKQRVHAVLLAHGKPCPVSDLFGVAGRDLLERLALPRTVAGHARGKPATDRRARPADRRLRTRATTTRRRAPLRAAPGHPLRNRFGARLHGAHETARHSARADMLGRAARSVSPCPAPEPLPALRAVTSVRSAVRQFRKCSVRRSRLAATKPQEIASPSITVFGESVISMMPLCSTVIRSRSSS